VSSGEWLIDAPTLRRLPGGGSRIDLAVAGFPLWFESPDAVLSPRVEAWIAALAIPAARIDAELILLEPLPDPAWLAEVQRNVACAAGWWGGEDAVALRSVRPDGPPTVAPVPPGPAAGESEAAGAGAGGRRGHLQCFTGGVDSFFSLLTQPSPPTHLLFVHGFDVALDDAERRAAVSATVREVAAERGVAAIELATNLHAHPAFSSASWEHTHGAALAACAILLGDVVERLTIPPSYALDRQVPWGSRPDLDARWSVPGVVAVAHGDASGARIHRVEAIGDHPVVRRHLRVCWEGRNRGVNCGECEKCLWVAAALAAHGWLAAVETFPGDLDVPAGIDALPATRPASFEMWRDVRVRSGDPALVGAIDRLLARSTGDAVATAAPTPV